MSTDMTPPYELDWDTFTEHCHTVDDIDVQETNPEKTYLTVEGLDDTPPLVVAELFTTVTCTLGRSSPTATVERSRSTSRRAHTPISPPRHTTVAH